MNNRQGIKLLAIVFLAYFFSYGLIYFGGERVAIVFDDLLSAFLMVLTVICAMSFLMFTYVDNTAKDLTDLRSDVDREKYVKVHICLSDLKREILLNIAFIVAIFLIEKSIKSFVLYAESEHLFANEWLLKTVGISIRFAFFSVAVWSSFTQFLGFVIAVEYRELIGRNRK